MSQRTALYRRHKDKTVEETAANIFGQHGRDDHRRKNATWPRVRGDGRPCSLPMTRAKAQRLAASLHRSK